MSFHPLTPNSFAHDGREWTVEMRSATKVFLPPGWTVLVFRSGKERRWLPYLRSYADTMTAAELRELVEQAAPF